MWDWLKGFVSGLLQDAVKGIFAAGLGATVVSLAVALWASGWVFLKDAHPVRGWVILSGIGLAVLLLTSAALNVIQWRRTRQRTFAIVAEGHPGALRWGMDPENREMFVIGHFQITNLTSNDLRVPRTELIVSYRLWRVIPWRKRVVGMIGNNGIKARIQRHEQFMWTIAPPILKRKQNMRAQAVIVDGFNRANESDWYRWRYIE